MMFGNIVDDPVGTIYTTHIGEDAYVKETGASVVLVNVRIAIIECDCSQGNRRHCAPLTADSWSIACVELRLLMTENDNSPG